MDRLPARVDHATAVWPKAVGRSTLLDIAESAIIPRNVESQLLHVTYTKNMWKY